jgi:hypothetical protein
MIVRMRGEFGQDKEEIACDNRNAVYTGRTKALSHITGLSIIRPFKSKTVKMKVLLKN